MAVDRPEVWLPGRIATGDLSSSQYLLVKAASTAGAVKVVTAATDDPMGVLYNEPGDGAAAEVVAGGVVKAIAGGTITYGTHYWLKPNTTGQVVASTTDQDNVVGCAPLASAASGELVSFVWAPGERSTS